MFRLMDDPAALHGRKTESSRLAHGRRDAQSDDVVQMTRQPRVHTRRAESTLRASPVKTDRAKSSLRCERCVLLAKFVHATAGVDDLLFTGVERMAAGADFDLKILSDGGSGQKCISAGAGDGDCLVVGMDAGFHRCLVTIMTAESIRPRLSEGRYRHAKWPVRRLKLVSPKTGRRL